MLTSKSLCRSGLSFFLMLLAFGAGCSARSDSPASVGRATAALDPSDTFPPTTYRFRIEEVVGNVWGYDDHVVLWAGLGVQVNDAQPDTAGCTMSDTNYAVSSVACINGGPLIGGSPPWRTATVARPTDNVRIGIALDNLANAVAPPGGDGAKLGTALHQASDVGGGIAAFLGAAEVTAPAGVVLGIISAGLALAADSISPPDAGQSCNGGLIGTLPNVGSSGCTSTACTADSPLDTLYFSLTAKQLHDYTLAGTANVTFHPSVDWKGGHCHAAHTIVLSIARDWNAGGLAASPRSPDGAVARLSDELNWFQVAPATAVEAPIPVTVMDNYPQMGPSFGKPTRVVERISGGQWTTGMPFGTAAAHDAEAHFVVLSRTPDTLDVFWNDAGGIVMGTYSNAGGWQSNPVPLNMGSNYRWSRMTAASRTTRNIDAFAIGYAGLTQASCVDPDNGCTWTYTTVPGTSVVANEGGFIGGGVAAVARTATSLDVFYVGNDSAVHRSAWQEGGTWATFAASPTRIAGPGADLAAVARTVNNLDTFVIGNDGGLWTSSWDANIGSFTTYEIPGTAGLAAPGANVSAVSREPGSLDVAFAGLDKVYVSSWKGFGHEWTTTALPSGRPYAKPKRVSIVARTSLNLDVVFSDVYGQTYASADSYFNPGWSPVVGIGLRGTNVVRNQLVDFTGDGLPDYADHDLVTGQFQVHENRGHQLTIGTGGKVGENRFLGFAAEAWASGNTFTGGGPFEAGVMTGDFNGDGYADVAVRRESDGRFDVHLNPSVRGGWFSPFVFASASTCVGCEVLVADFTGDGYADIAERDPATGQIDVRENLVKSGVQGFAPPGTYWATGKACWSFANCEVFVGDFTGDGYADVAERDPSTGKFAVHATYVFWDFVTYTAYRSFDPHPWATGVACAGTGPSCQVLVADFNGDRQADIAEQDTRSGTFYVHLDQGQGNSFSPPGDNYITWTSCSGPSCGVLGYEGRYASQ